MTLGAHRDEHRGGQTQLLGIEQGHPARDNSAVFQPPDPPPAGVARQADAFTHFVDRQRGIGLQHAKDRPINGVKLH